MVRRMNAGQIDDARLVEADLHRAFVVCIARPRKRAASHRCARDGGKERALAAVRQADERNTQPAVAAEQRLAERDRRYLSSRRVHRCSGSAAVRVASAVIVGAANPAWGVWTSASATSSAMSRTIASSRSRAFAASLIIVAQ